MKYAKQCAQLLTNVLSNQIWFDKVGVMVYFGMVFLVVRGEGSWPDDLPLVYRGVPVAWTRAGGEIGGRLVPG